MSGMRAKYVEMVKQVYGRLGYTLDHEILDVLLDDAQHKLVRAPAGGTKTTVSMVWVNLEKVKRMVNFLLAQKIGEIGRAHV